MKLLSIFRKPKNRVERGKYFISIAALLIQSVAMVMQAPTTSAAPTFSTNPTTSTYTTYRVPGSMTVAGGDMWYLQRSTPSGSVDSIARMTTGGTVTNYSLSIGATPTSDVRMTTGADGNIWLIRLGLIYKFDISTGAVTYYGGGSSYGTGSIASGSDGKIYFTYKYNGAPADSYLMSLDPATGTIATVQMYYAPSNIGNLLNGPDGRLYYVVGNTIIARSLSGGSGGGYMQSTYIGHLASGSDGNIWFSLGAGKVAKMTPAGVTTEYTLPANVYVTKITAGPDGAMWFTGSESSVQKIGRISTTTGSITMYTIPGTSVHYEVGGPVLGTDGAIWFSYKAGSVQYLGRLGY